MTLLKQKLSAETFDLVNWIVENDLAKNLEIRFVTNGMTEKIYSLSFLSVMV